MTKIINPIGLLPTKRFQKSFKKLDKHNQARLHKALGLFVSNRHHPSLHFKNLGDVMTGLCSIRFGQGYRIIMKDLGGGKYELTDCGNHDIVEAVDSSAQLA